MDSKQKNYRYSKTVNEKADDDIWRSRDGHRFFQITPWCPYCLQSTIVVYSNEKTIAPPQEDHELWYQEDSITVYVCEQCGWWYIVDGSDHEEGESDDSKWYTRSYRRSVLDVHDLTSPNIPIDALAQEIKKKEDIIHHIHHRAMESLVAGVMREHFPGCEVELCGKSCDGGVDLYVVRGDKTIGVQVKRRMSPESIERVSTVREFFGAGIAKKLRNLMFVSTAKRFTAKNTGAVQFAKNVVDDKIIDSFELINRDKFTGMLNLIVKKNEYDFWKNHIW